MSTLQPYHPKHLFTAGEQVVLRQPLHGERCGCLTQSFDAEVIQQTAKRVRVRVTVRGQSVEAVVHPNRLYQRINGE